MRQLNCKTIPNKIFGDNMKLHRKALLATVAAAAMAAAFFSTSASAGYSYYRVTNYYSDATMTEIVGYSVINCNGVRVKQGTVTNFRELIQEPC
jgi:hypothetical protein